MSQSNALAVVILAAGKGTRMKSSLPKVMHPLLGLPMINWLLNSVQDLDPERTIVVIGEDMETLASAVSPHETVIQHEQTGTGSALKCALDKLADFTGDILVLLGDTPLISVETMQNLIAARYESEKTAIAVLGVELENPTGYGRLILDADGSLRTIREEKDANTQERAIRTVNTGAFCLDAQGALEWVAHLDNNNAQGEYYITDLPEIAARTSDLKTAVAVTRNAAEVQGCNTRLDLAALEDSAQEKMRNAMILNGVIMQDPKSVYLHHDTQIASGTLIEPHVYFGPNVSVGQNVHIKAFCHFEGAVIEHNAIVGPFARLRPGTSIGEEVRIGNFVEIKKSDIGARSKISHLGYVGDCIMGRDVNFSCGAITVNYDGYQKHQTHIGDNVMVGSNVSLIAPLRLENGAFIAAGSTITTDVPADSLSVERGTAEVRAGWTTEYRKRKENND